MWTLERWYWWTYLQDSKRDMDIENRLVSTVWAGEGGAIWESSTLSRETCITICKIGSQWAFAVWCGDPKASAQWNRERWDGMGGRFKRKGTCVYLWLIHVGVWQKPSQHCNDPPIKDEIKFKKEKQKNNRLKWLARGQEKLESQTQDKNLHRIQVTVLQKLVH